MIKQASFSFLLNFVFLPRVVLQLFSFPVTFYNKFCFPCQCRVRTFPIRCRVSTLSTHCPRLNHLMTKQASFVFVLNFGFLLNFVLLFKFYFPFRRQICTVDFAHCPHLSHLMTKQVISRQSRQDISCLTYSYTYYVRISVRSTGFQFKLYMYIHCGGRW